MIIKSLIHKEYFWVYFTAFLFVVLNSLLMALGIYYLPLLPVLFILGWIAFSSLNTFLIVTVFFVPLSIPLSWLTEIKTVDLSLPAEIFLAGILILIFLKYIRGQRLDSRILGHPVSLAIYFYLAWTLITGITSSMPVVSFKYFLARLWFIVAFYFLAAQFFQESENIRKYLWAYIIPFALVIVYVIIRHSSYGLNNQQAAHFVVKPFYNDHTSYGAAIAMIIPVLAGLFQAGFRNLNKIYRILFLFLIVYFIAAILFSYTRAGWVSLFVALSVWILIRLKIRWIFIFAGFMIMVVIAFAYRAEIEMSLTRNKQTSSGNVHEHIQSIANIRNDASNLERLNRWSCAWRMFKEKPVTGWGPGTYMFNYAPFQLTKDKTIISTNAGTRGNAHSEYLGALSESGILGLISFILIILATIFTAIRVYLNTRRRKIRILSLAVLLGLVTYYVHGFLNNFLDSDKLSALFWGFTAILVAMDIYHSGHKDKKIYSPEN